MQVAYEVLRCLSDGKFHSGTSLAQLLKVSRSSIWKGVHFLRKLELPIHAVTGRGYRWAEPVELLNKKEILAGLNTTTQSYLPRLEVVNVISSTNDYLIQRLGHGICSGTVCVAEAQTAGKGRLGKKWFSPYGANVYLSLYWRFPNKLYDLSGLSLVVGLSILEALKEIAPLPDGLGIKWPNDIWYFEAKLCGILIESLGVGGNFQPSSSTDVVIGIGINVAPLSKKSSYIWTNLTQILGFTPSRNGLISNILNSLIVMLRRFQQQGFPAFCSLWSRYDLLFGKKVHLFTNNCADVGIAQGVNERGELCVKIGDSLKAIRYGEVSVRPEG